MSFAYEFGKQAAFTLLGGGLGAGLGSLRGYSKDVDEDDKRKPSQRAAGGALKGGLIGGGIGAGLDLASFLYALSKVKGINDRVNLKFDQADKRMADSFDNTRSLGQAARHLMNHNSSSGYHSIFGEGDNQ